MSQFQDRTCAACGHADRSHSAYGTGCYRCSDEHRCMAFVEKSQALPVKVEVFVSKPKELPPKQETTTIVRMRTVTTVPRRRRGLVDWLINW